MSDFKVLVCEDDKNIQLMVETFLNKENDIQCRITGSGAEFFEELEKEEYHVVILDVRLPDISGLEILKKLKNHHKRPIIIMMTAHSSENLVIESMRSGAYNYLRKPFDINYFITTVREAALEYRRKQVTSTEKGVTTSFPLPTKFISKSPVIKKLEEKIAKLSQKNLSILLTGESGTGKEYYAKLIYDGGSRSSKSFVDVNCPAIPQNLVESELFGHEKGSFTGANETKIGKFEAADGGVLFLDEVGDLPMETQTKLLRVLQEREIVRVGSVHKIEIDVFLVTATSRNLKELINEDKFRPDLYYRICDIELEIPPLRDRIEDIPDLVDYFATEYAKENNEDKRKFSPEVIDYLMGYNWPGNIRELRSFVRKVLILSDSENIERDEIEGDLHSQFIDSQFEITPKSNSGKSASSSSDSLNIHENEIDLIKKALEECDYNLTKAAALIGFSRSTLYRKIKKYGIKS